MALPSTGSISMSQVNVELKKNETSVITLNDTNVRKLAGKPSGVISMNDLRGKSNTEYVENYLLYKKDGWGDNSTLSETFGYPKRENINIKIPNKIISGTIKIEFSSHRRCSSTPKPSLSEIACIEIYNIGKVEGNEKSLVKQFSVSNLSNNLSGYLYSGALNGGGRKYGFDVFAKVYFTGECEA